MKVLIVEDELLAEQTLCRALQRNFQDVEIMGVTRSVISTVEWIREHGDEVDIVFMDIELQDGSSFHIFESVQISAPVVITTAYSKYGVPAFEAGCIDYLLKPITDGGLLRAVDRACSRKQPADTSQLIAAINGFLNQQKDECPNVRKNRFIIRSGQKIIPIEIKDIAYFYMEGKSKYIVKTDGSRYFMDYRMENVIEELDMLEFFRVSRNHIVSIHSIDEIKRLTHGRLKITLKSPQDEIMVSRARVHDFLEWIS